MLIFNNHNHHWEICTQYSAKPLSVFNKQVDVKTHQLKGKEEDEEDPTGEHGEAQQEHQRLILADAREFAV